MLLVVLGYIFGFISIFILYKIDKKHHANKYFEDDDSKQSLKNDLTAMSVLWIIPWFNLLLVLAAIVALVIIGISKLTLKFIK